MDHQVHARPTGGAVAGDAADEAPAPDRAGRFELVKWYLDAVAPDGVAAIAYWASLRWHGARLTWHNVTRYAPDKPPLEASSVVTVAAPAVDGRRIAWTSDRLKVATTHDRTAPGATLVLLDRDDGRITWECLAPAAQARIAQGDDAIVGTGYAERLSMTVPPWALPIDELRWGRWIADDASSSVVWIDWRGALPRQWVVINGQEHAGAVVRDDGVRLGAAQLALAEPRTLHVRSVGRYLRGIAALARVAARIPLAWEESKLCARGTWDDGTGRRLDGWAIYECVRLR